MGLSTYYGPVCVLLLIIYYVREVLSVINRHRLLFFSLVPSTSYGENKTEQHCIRAAVALFFLSLLYHVIGMAYTEATARRNVYWKHNLALGASRLCQMEDRLRLEQQTHTISCRHVIGVSSYFVLFFLTDMHSFKSSGRTSKAGLKCGRQFGSTGFLN